MCGTRSDRGSVRAAAVLGMPRDGSMHHVQGSEGEGSAPIQTGLRTTPSPLSAHAGAKGRYQLPLNWANGFTSSGQSISSSFTSFWPGLTSTLRPLVAMSIAFFGNLAGGAAGAFGLVGSCGSASDGDTKAT